MDEDDYGYYAYDDDEEFSYYAFVDDVAPSLKQRFRVWIKYTVPVRLRHWRHWLRTGKNDYDDIPF